MDLCHCPVTPGRQHRLLVGLTVLMLTNVPMDVSSARVPEEWEKRPYPYSIVRQDVAEALRNFGYNTGVNVSLAPEVQGAVQGHIKAKTARKFLDQITRSNGLDWYFDGTVIYVSPTSQEQTAVISLNGMPFDRVKNQIAREKLVDSQYRLSQQGAGDALVVSGPPSYVAVMKQAVDAITSNRKSPVTGEPGSLIILRGNQTSSLKLP